MCQGGPAETPLIGGQRKGKETSVTFGEMKTYLPQDSPHFRRKHEFSSPIQAAVRTFSQDERQGALNWEGKVLVRVGLLTEGDHMPRLARANFPAGYTHPDLQRESRAGEGAKSKGGKV